MADVGLKGFAVLVELLVGAGDEAGRREIVFADGGEVVEDVVDLVVEVVGDVDLEILAVHQRGVVVLGVGFAIEVRVGDALEQLDGEAADFVGGAVVDAQAMGAVAADDVDG